MIRSGTTTCLGPTIHTAVRAGVFPQLRLLFKLCQYQGVLSVNTRANLGTTSETDARQGLQSPKADDDHHPRWNTPFIVFDTAKNSKCQLTTQRRNLLTWYSCGPTVYDSAHIGHASSFIRQDVIRRILQSGLGTGGGNQQVSVIQVMGVTDIDDKIIKKAQETGEEWSAISRHYEREFLEDLSSLKCLSPHVFTRVSDYIPEILKFVTQLVASGFAYEVPSGSVYFDMEKYGSRYGVLRRQVEGDNLENSTESSDDDGKRNSRDFALWKGAKPGEPFWNSPWGTEKRGRPGWHIECSVMASHFFGSTLDLHTGGRDLIFPHHENEEAQCCAHFQSSQWTAHWLHMGHLHFKGDVQKMSKSLGNTVSIRHFLEHHSPDVLRMLCIMAKYRKNLDYSPDTLDIAQKILRKLHTFLSDAGAILNGTKRVQSANSQGSDENFLWNQLDNSRSQLTTALLDDFDTPEALKTVTELISNFNRHFLPADTVKHLQHESPVNYQLVLSIKAFVEDFLQLVGLSSSSSSTSSASPISSRTEADPRLDSVLHQFVQFRSQVRSYSLALDEQDSPSKEVRKQRINERKSLLQACDKVRTEMLAENGVEIKDHGRNSSWSFAVNQGKNS